MALTPAQQQRAVGFKANLAVRGRPMYPFEGDAQGDGMKAIVQECPALIDMEQPAQAKNPVYVWINALNGTVDSPRAVTKFAEVGDDGKPTSKTYAVIGYEETSADVIVWKWKCEAARQD